MRFIMSFGLHLVLAIVWALITLGVAGIGVWSVIAGTPVVLPVTCLLLVAISSRFIINDVKTLFLNKNNAPPAPKV
jgi:hypothetical protein